MLDLSRRQLVVSTALAAAFGLNTRLAISPAFAQKTPEPPKGFYQYKVGSVEVTALYDGIWEKPHDPAFIKNASVQETIEALKTAGLPTDFVSIPLTVLVVTVNGQHILIDSGSGGQWQPTAGKLHANMKAARIDPTKIRTVLISHFHPDHIFGLMERGTNKPIWPDAELIVSASEYKWWSRGEAARSAQTPWPANQYCVSELEEFHAHRRRAGGGARHPPCERPRPHTGSLGLPHRLGQPAAHDFERHCLCACAAGTAS